MGFLSCLRKASIASCASWRGCWIWRFKKSHLYTLSTAGTISMPTVRNSSNFRNGLKQLPTSSNLIFPKEWSNSSVTASWFVKPKFGKGSSTLGAWGTFKAGVVLEARSALFSSFSSAFLFPPFWKYSRHTLKRQKEKFPRKTECCF